MQFNAASWLTWLALGAPFALLALSLAVLIVAVLRRPGFWSDMFASTPGDAPHPARYVMLIATVAMAIKFLSAVISASGPDQIKAAVTLTDSFGLDGAAGVTSLLYLAVKLTDGDILGSLSRSAPRAPSR